MNATWTASESELIIVGLDEWHLLELPRKNAEQLYAALADALAISKGGDEA